MYFTLRYVLLKYDRFLLIHPVYIPYTVIPHPTRGLRCVITACWVKLCSENFIWEKYTYMNAGTYGNAPQPMFKI